MSRIKTKFRRKLSLPLYKSLRLSLAEMSFSKDFIGKPHGDLYPLLFKTDDCAERIENGVYTVEKGKAIRLFSAFFPYASYELSATVNGGAAGLCFSLPSATATLSLEADGRLVFTSGEKKESALFPLAPSKKAVLIVSCRPGAFDVYKREGDCITLVTTFETDAFLDSAAYRLFSEGTVSLVLSGGASAHGALSFMDNGIAIADMRPIRYENGEVMLQEGKLYFTASLRMQKEAFLGILSWVPGTAALSLTGALFFDAGDGLWANDVAASLLYHREEGRWLLWACSFAHGHILGHAAFLGDVRFGVNAIDLSLMQEGEKDAPRTLFLGFEGDEDPDFIYDAEAGRWLFSVCRLDEESKQYRYFFFESDSPFENYRFLGKGEAGAETGGSFVKTSEGLYFVCGNGYDKRAEYRIYERGGFSLASFDYDDGGFRGWGTVVPVKMGSRERLFWLTFDRQNASDFNWSYGNFYCFEAP